MQCFIPIQLKYNFAHISQLELKFHKRVIAELFLIISYCKNRITHFMIKVKHFMKENALLNALYMVSQQSIPRTFYRLIFSCHSLRKTFGYYAWQEGVQPALLMNVFNHSSFHITKRYLGIEQDEKDLVYLNINL